MNFAQFLMTRRTKKNIKTAKDHYLELGGDEILEISLRHFQQIESGKYPPSEKLLLILFQKTPLSERKDLLLAFFRSILAENSSEELIGYLEQYLSPAIETESKSIWESNRKMMVYDDEQLNYLVKNEDAFRFHRKLILFEKCSKKDCDLKSEKLKQLKKLNLIEMDNKEIRPSRNLYRLPTYETSNPRAVSKATDLILKHVDLYVSKEGSAKQEIGYAFQMASPEVAQRVRDQMKAFKRWVQSMASTAVGPGVAPLIMVGFVKELDRKEL